jgi:hypothetical protein
MEYFISTVRGNTNMLHTLRQALAETSMESMPTRFHPPPFSPYHYPSTAYIDK